MKPLTVLSLFDGIAGARLAIERAGLPLAAYYASEINPYAIKVAQHNWPDIREIGNVKLLSWLGFHVDLLIGGSPCQGFSKVGTQLNFEDKRSKLFFEFIRIKQMVNPTWWLLENVVMKQEWQNIISGYLGVEPRLINSAAFSAQSRPRHYWTNIPIADDAESPIWTWREMDNKLDWILLDDWKEIEPLFLSQRELDYMNRATKDGRTIPYGPA